MYAILLTYIFSVYLNTPIRLLDGVQQFICRTYEELSASRQVHSKGKERKEEEKKE